MPPKTEGISQHCAMGSQSHHPPCCSTARGRWKFSHGAVINERRSFCSSRTHSLHQLHLSRGDERQSTAGPSREAEGTAPGEGRAAAEGAGMWKQRCPRGSAHGRAGQQHREPRAGRWAREPSHSRSPSSRGTQRSGLGRLPRPPLPAALRPETTPRGFPQPYPEGAAPLPAPPGRSTGSGCAGGTFALSSGQGCARRAPTAPRDNEIEVNPGPRDGDAAVPGLRTAERALTAAVPSRRRGEGRPLGPGARERGAPRPPRAARRAPRSAERNRWGAALPWLRRPGTAVRRTHRSRHGPPRSGNFHPAAPRPPAPPRPREEPTEHRAQGSRSAPGPRRPRVRPPPPASPSRTGCSRLPLPSPPTSRCPPTCPRSAGIIPGAGGAGRGQLLSRRLCVASAAPRCREERGRRGAPALPRGGGWLYPPGRAVPPAAGSRHFLPRAGPALPHGGGPRGYGAAWRPRGATPRGRGRPRRGGCAARLQPAAGFAAGRFTRALYGRAGREILTCQERHRESWEVCYREERYLARARGERTTPRLSKSRSSFAGGEAAAQLWGQEGARTAVTAPLRSGLSCCCSRTALVEKGSAFVLRATNFTRAY